MSGAIPPPPPPHPERLPWYFSDAFIAISFLFCTPVGIALMWAGNRSTMGWRIAATLFFVFAWLLLMTKGCPGGA